MGVVLLAGAALATACEPQTDAQPTVATVNFEPRVIITVDDGGISGLPGERDGAQIGHGDTSADLIAPAGSVAELHNDATGPRRVVVTRSPVESSDPADATVWLDTGDLQPGESVVLGLSAVGDYGFTETPAGPSGQGELTVRITPRPAT